MIIDAAYERVLLHQTGEGFQLNFGALRIVLIIGCMFYGRHLHDLSGMNLGISEAKERERYQFDLSQQPSRFGYKTQIATFWSIALQSCMINWVPDMGIKAHDTCTSRPPAFLHIPLLTYCHLPDSTCIARRISHHTSGLRALFGTYSKMSGMAGLISVHVATRDGVLDPIGPPHPKYRIPTYFPVYNNQFPTRASKYLYTVTNTVVGGCRLSPEVRLSQPATTIHRVQ